MAPRHLTIAAPQNSQFEAPGTSDGHLVSISCWLVGPIQKIQTQYINRIAGCLIFVCYFQASEGGGQKERRSGPPASVSPEHAARLLSDPGQEEPQEIQRSE